MLMVLEGEPDSVTSGLGADRHGRIRLDRLSAVDRRLRGGVYPRCIVGLASRDPSESDEARRPRPSLSHQNALRSVTSKLRGAPRLVVRWLDVEVA